MLKRTLVGMLTLAAFLSITPPASSNQLNNLYESCYKEGNNQSCGALGRLCGRGNVRACNLINTVSNAGIVQIDYYCRVQNNRRACNFLQQVNELGGPANLGNLCSQGDRASCNSLVVIVCYASENARAGRPPLCGLL
ncbi:MAG: hypothetical protein F6K35_37160 [Okeania sp. SIO2H7]|nr:hypothetical protein [Okeania sp. SIO2H7]